MAKVIPLIVSVVLAFIGVVGDAFIRRAGAGPKFMDVKWFVIGSVVYTSTIIGWFFVMKYLKFSTIGVFYGVSTLLFLVVAGILFYNERPNVAEITGIGFAVISMILLGRYA